MEIDLTEEKEDITEMREMTGEIGSQVGEIGIEREITVAAGMTGILTVGIEEAAGIGIEVEITEEEGTVGEEERTMIQDTRNRWAEAVLLQDGRDMTMNLSLSP